jgi:hypothetical protein
MTAEGLGSVNSTGSLWRTKKLQSLHDYPSDDKVNRDHLLTETDRTSGVSLCKKLLANAATNYC